MEDKFRKLWILKEKILNKNLKGDKMDKINYKESEEIGESEKDIEIKCVNCGEIILDEIYQDPTGNYLCKNCLKEHLFSEYKDFFKLENMKKREISNLEKEGDFKRYRMIYDITVTANREIDAIEYLGIEYDPNFMQVMDLVDCIGSNCKTFIDEKHRLSLNSEIKDNTDVEICEFYRNGKCILS